MFLFTLYHKQEEIIFNLILGATRAPWVCVFSIPPTSPFTEGNRLQTEHLTDPGKIILPAPKTGKKPLLVIQEPFWAAAGIFGCGDPTEKPVPGLTAEPGTELTKTWRIHYIDKTPPQKLNFSLLFNVPSLMWGKWS